jgi:hypothetical protein
MSCGFRHSIAETYSATLVIRLKNGADVRARTGVIGARSTSALESAGVYSLMTRRLYSFRQSGCAEAEAQEIRSAATARHQYAIGGQIRKGFESELHPNMTF